MRGREGRVPALTPHPSLSKGELVEGKEGAQVLRQSRRLASGGSRPLGDSDAENGPLHNARQHGLKIRQSHAYYIPTYHFLCIK